MVRVPLYTPFRLHSLDTLTGEKYPKTIKNRFVRSDVINKLIDDRVRCIRHTKLRNNDVFMIYLNNVLDSLTVNGVVSKVDMSDKDYNYYIIDKSNITK